MDKGLVGAIKSQSPKTGNEVSRQEFDSFKSQFVKVRVLDIIYDENSNDFKEFGSWNGLGTIKFEVVDFQTRKDTSRGTARPIFPNFKNGPLKNEIVYIFKLPAEQNSYTDNSEFYYLPPVPIWNHPHHNAMPNLIDGLDDENQKQDYEQIEGGSVRRVTDESTDIPLNNNENGTFVEKTDIHPLLPFAGDVILEGRFGNSIRLGNTSKTDSSYANIWSTTGNNGDPITIIRNGQPESGSAKGWLPITENVNTDLSSVTLTSTQQLPIELSIEDYSAFKNAPETAANYSENQAVLNSGRLVFNSKSSDIILSSAENLSITAVKTVGVTSNADITLNSSDVRLGNKDANQRLVLGDDFMTQFEALVQGVKNLSDKLKTLQNWPGGAAVPNVPVMTVAINTAIVAQKILDNMKGDNKLLSKVSKTS